MWYTAIVEHWRRWRLQAQETYVPDAWLRDYARRECRQEFNGPRWRWPIQRGRVEADITLNNVERRDR
jgi:hypothetical protein